MKNIRILEDLAEIRSVDEQKKSIDAHRPFSKELENKIFQKLKLDWNYNSNAIEGNQLSYGETVAFLNFGLTAKGKPFKDHLDIKGHNEAIGFMLQLIKEDRPLSESDIKDLHKIILVEPYYSTTVSPQGIEFQKEIKVGQYKTSPNHVKTVSGDIHYYTNPEEVAFEMNNLLDWYRNAEEENLHPVVMSAIFHHKFTSIHPFDDGNGRLARILSNFILLKHHYPVLVIKNKEKIQYYAALNIADNGIYEDLVKLFAENISLSFDIIQKAINGENINEPDDLDKEIELFTKEMRIQDIQTLNFTNDRDFLLNNYVKGFLEYLLPKLNKVGELFQDFRILLIEKIPLLDPKYHTYNSNDLDKIYDDQINYESILFRVYFVFNKLIKRELEVNIDLKIILNKKSVKYQVFENVGDLVFEKDFFYSQNIQPIYKEIATPIIHYLINMIKIDDIINSEE